ncbi:hypothetical protein CH367_02175 [Leptospira barantonii]|uniref:Uncharacterized protein n=1 Tax=Leptospira barantonii TaxID=2023184 RepID=A0ABX4NPW2_9LEPT|nr:hypothetical protein CH367_02175 [Leptospira barantonii]
MHRIKFLVFKNGPVFFSEKPNVGTPATDTFQWMDNNLPGCVPPLRIFILKRTGGRKLHRPLFLYLSSDSKERDNQKAVERRTQCFSLRVET